MVTRRLWLLVLPLAIAAGCTPRVYSPPGRAMPLEAPTPLGEGNTAVQVEGGVSGMVFGPSFLHGSVRLRHGVSDQLEVDGELNAVGVMVPSDADWDDDSDAHRGIYSAHVALKRNFSRHFALRFGAGGGVSAGGAFFAPDLGFVVGYDNPAVVPFVGAYGFVSYPLGPRYVRFVDESTGDEQILRPRTTVGVGWSTGIKVPFGAAIDLRQRRAAFLVGIGGTFVQSFGAEADNDATFGLSLGLDYTF
ncbi:MAG: hypothetical protein R3B99_17295 [Polyangiales bacterium]|nr:hypothetical protein [Myxococcales bacterium]